MRREAGKQVFPDRGYEKYAGKMIAVSGCQEFCTAQQEKTGTISVSMFAGCGTGKEQERKSGE